MKKLAYIALGLLLAVSLGLASLITPDNSFDDIAPLYKNENSQIITLPSGQTVHFRDEGVRGALPLILLHGSNASLHTWEPWVERLKPSYRIITLDFPAHGLTGVSARDDYTMDAFVSFVDAFVTAQGIEQFVLGGNSMGGNVSWRYALAHTQKVRGLILVDASGYPRVGNKGPLIFRLLAYAPFRWLFQNISVRSLTVEGVRNAYNNAPVVTDRLIKRYVDLNLLPGYRRGNALRFAEYQKGKLEQPPAGRINTPTLILWGKEDRLIPVAHAKRFHRDFPNSTLVLYDNVGHLPQEEIPGRTARDVRTFLQGMRWGAGAKVDERN